jgi:LacI family transcriptional regulator
MIGFKGAELLDRLMRGDKPPKNAIRIKPDGVIVRQSSDIVAVAEVHVAKAVDFIIHNHHKQITVDDVVTASGASRRNLYVKFAAHVGHSIHQEIVRQQLEHVKYCLRDSNAKLQAIAEECGFGDASQLSKIFQHHLGISVSHFRKEQER